MFELDGIVIVRRPEGGRWNDGSTYRLGVRLVDPETQQELYEEAAVEEVQSYAAFQCFVARELGVWYRYQPAERPTNGMIAWSELVEMVWGREKALDQPEYFDAAPWVDEGSE